MIDRGIFTEDPHRKINSEAVDADSPIDLCGIGLGPSNLSLAALLSPITGLRKVFLEARESFKWHPGLMFPGAELQVSFLKDLVTPVDPTNAFSFLNFLVENERLYRFMIAQRGSQVTREEFNQYYAWAASRIPFAHFGQRVRTVEHDGRSFVVSSATDRVTRSRHLVVGVGHEPYVPDGVRVPLGDRVVHTNDFLHAGIDFAGKTVVVVGGGQSGAEVIDRLLSRRDDLPRHVTWVSRQHGFLPLDDSAFANEWFNPAFVRTYYDLPEASRRTLLQRQRTASNGISEDLLERIYRNLYELDYLTDAKLTYQLRTSCELLSVDDDGDGLRIVLRDLERDSRQSHYADVAVLATGYRHVVPGFLQPLLGTADLGELKTCFDYSLDWHGAEQGRIYLQNGAEHTHGIADPNLSLAAWRSAVIANSLLGRDVYRTAEGGSVMWPAGAANNRPDIGRFSYERPGEPRTSDDPEGA